MSWAHQDVPCWAIVAGQTTSPEVIAELGRLRNKREQLVQALRDVRPHHRFILAELLCQIDSINETIKRFNEQIEVFCHPLRRRYNCWTLSWGGTADRRGNCLRNGY